MITKNTILSGSEGASSSLSTGEGASSSLSTGEGASSSLSTGEGASSSLAILQTQPESNHLSTILIQPNLDVFIKESLGKSLEEVKIMNSLCVTALNTLHKWALGDAPSFQGQPLHVPDIETVCSKIKIARSILQLVIRLKDTPDEKKRESYLEEINKLAKMQHEVFRFINTTGKLVENYTGILSILEREYNLQLKLNQRILTSQNDYRDFLAFYEKIKNAAVYKNSFIRTRLTELPKPFLHKNILPSNISGASFPTRIVLTTQDIFMGLKNLVLPPRTQPFDAELERELPRVAEISIPLASLPVESKSVKDLSQEMIGLVVSQYEYMELRKTFQRGEDITPELVTSFFDQSQQRFLSILETHAKTLTGEKYQKALKENIDVTYEWGYYEQKALYAFYSAFAQNNREIQLYLRNFKPSDPKIVDMDPDFRAKFESYFFLKQAKQDLSDCMSFFKFHNESVSGRLEALNYMINYYYDQSLRFPNYSQALENTLLGLHLKNTIQNFNLHHGKRSYEFLETMLRTFDDFFIIEYFSEKNLMEELTHTPEKTDLALGEKESQSLLKSQSEPQPKETPETSTSEQNKLALEALNELKKNNQALNELKEQLEPINKAASTFNTLSKWLKS